MRIFIAIVFSFSIVFNVQAQTVDKKYLKEYEEFLKYSLAVDMVDILMNQFEQILDEDAYASLHGTVDIFAEMEDMFHEFMMTEMLDFYKDRLSYKDLKNINKFYRSPTGRKVKGYQTGIIVELLPRMEPLFDRIEKRISDALAS